MLVGGLLAGGAAVLQVSAAVAAPEARHALTRAAPLLGVERVAARVFDARGRALGTIKLPRPPQNLAFAGTGRKTPYVVGRGAVWKIRTLAAGPAGRSS